MDAHRQLTQRDVMSMLSAIPAEDRETWVKVGMAIHAEFGDDGFGIWDDWSQNADNYNVRDAQNTWRSFKRGTITIGTLVHTAKQYGWRPDQPFTAPPPKPRTAPKAVTKDTGLYAKELWLSGNWDDDAVAAHPYAQAKGITHAGGAKRGIASGRVIGKNADCVIVPIYDIATGKVEGVQCINPEGKKQTFGPVSGNGLLLGNTLDKKLTWYVCEGWASTYSVVFHHQKGNGVCACSFGKANLETLMYRVGEAFSPDEIIMLQEKD